MSITWRTLEYWRIKWNGEWTWSVCRSVFVKWDALRDTFIALNGDVPTRLDTGWTFIHCCQLISRSYLLFILETPFLAGGVCQLPPMREIWVHFYEKVINDIAN